MQPCKLRLVLETDDSSRETDRLREADKSIGHGTHDADVEYNDNPEHDAKRCLLRLMAKLPLAHQRTGPSTQERHQVQSGLGHATPAVGGLPFIDPVCNKANETHHDNYDHVACSSNSRYAVERARLGRLEVSPG